MQKIGCAESHTEPHDIYQLAIRQGMTAVTITDHNSIDGCLEIAHLPNVITGCEYTTYFPEDRCKIHVLVYNLDEPQHQQLMQLRENIYELTNYLHRHNIPHACAHPLFGVNDRLTIDHVEKLILLFKVWEINGSLDETMNRVTDFLASMLSPELFNKLADKHGILPPFPQPYRKCLIGGSDDHSSLHLARTYTEEPFATDFDSFWAGVNNAKARVAFVHAKPTHFARHVYGTIYQYFKERFRLEKYVGKDPLLRFLDHTLQRRVEEIPSKRSWFQNLLARNRYGKNGSHPSEKPLVEILRAEAEKLISADLQLAAILAQGQGTFGDLDRVWFDFVNQISEKMFMHLSQHLLFQVLGARFFDVFHSLGSAGALYALILPHIVAFSVFSQQRDWSRRVRDHFSEPIPQGFKKTTKVAHFTDTFAEINGVTRTLKQQLNTALALNKDYTLITCMAEHTHASRGIQNFQPVGKLALEEYPGLGLFCPPFLRMLSYCYDEAFTHMHVSTPGLVGLSGLAIARILKLPVLGTYHTAFPEYVKTFTDDGHMEEWAWKYMLWFYGQMDRVLVPSQAVADTLARKGLQPEKIKLYPRGVDTDRFHPLKRNLPAPPSLGLSHQKLNLLYVGRISKEKNLHTLCDALTHLTTLNMPFHLTVVGDGPYRPEMEKRLHGMDAVFTGLLENEELSFAYASSDVLVFPSATDTFGNVVLEAQASGIPVIVSDQGGPKENLIPEKTGFVFSANDPESLAREIGRFITDPRLAREMGENARKYAETRGFKQAFEKLWDIYTYNKNDAPRAFPFEKLFASPVDDLFSTAKQAVL